MAYITKRNNSYLIRVSCGYDAQGKQVVRSMTWTPETGMTARQIEKEVNKQAVIFEESCLKGFQSKVVKFETLCEEWLEEYAKTNLCNTTYERLLQLRGRTYKALGNIHMDKITTRQIQTFINSLSKDGANAINGKPLSPKTVRHYLNLISDVYGYAIKMGVVSDNPCRNISLPKIVQNERHIYTLDEVNKFLTLLADEPLKYRVFFNLLVYSGFRRG